MTNFLKRGICIILIAVTLSTSFASTYFGAKEVCAAATFTALEGFIETLLTSLGYSCRSKADLTSITNGFKSQWENFKERGLFEGTAYNALSSVAVGIDTLINGSKFVCDSPVKIAIRDFALDYLRNRIAVSRGQTSAKQDSIDSYPETGGISEFRLGRLSETGLRSLWNNIPVKCGSEVVDSFSDNIFNYGACAVTTVKSDNGVRTWYVFFPKSRLTITSVYLQYSDDVLSVRNAVTGESYSLLDAWYCLKFVKESASADYVSVTGLGVSIKDDSSGSLYVNTSTTSVGGVSCYHPFSYYQSKETFEDGIDIIYASVGVYSSFNHFVAANDAVTSYPAADFVGDGSNAKNVSDNVAIGDGTSTQAIQDAVDQAIQNNPSISQEEIDAIVNSIISELDGVQDSIDEGNEAQATANSWLSKIYSKITSVLDVSLSSIKTSITSVSSSVVALSSVGDDILDETKTTSKKISTVGNWLPGLIVDAIFEFWNGVEQKQFRDDILKKLDEIKAILNTIAGKNFSPVVNVSSPAVTVPAPEVNVTVPAPEVNVTAPAPQVVVEGTDLSGISSMLSSIFVSLNDIKEIINSVPEKMDDLIGAVNSLPEKIAEPVINVTAEVPDVIVPEIEIPEIEVTVPKAQVVEVVQEVFLIDTERVHTDASRLLDSYNSFFPDLKILMGIILLFSFPSEVEYPIIKIQTPDILKNYFESEYIVLIDFEEYSVYLSWARNLIRAFIWIMFIYSIFGHFKVRFSVT